MFFPGFCFPASSIPYKLFLVRLANNSLAL